MTEQEKKHRLLVTRTVWRSASGEEDVYLHALFEEEPNRWSVISGAPRKNGEGTHYTFPSDYSSYILTKFGKDLIATVYLPKNSSLAQNTFWAILHVLAGYDPAEFLGMRRYRLFSRELGRIFKQAWDEGRIPVEICPTTEMILQLQGILDLSSLKIRRPSCVF